MVDDRLRQDAARYRLLRDYLLTNGFVIHQKIPEYQKPFVTDTDFYGYTFDEAVDALTLHVPERDASIVSSLSSKHRPNSDEGS